MVSWGGCDGVGIGSHPRFLHDLDIGARNLIYAAGFRLETMKARYNHALYPATHVPALHDSLPVPR